MDRNGLRVVPGEAGIAAAEAIGPALDPVAFQEECLRAFEVSQVARGFSEVTIGNGAGTLDIGPGFDVAAHLHRNAEELFYVLEGQLDLLAFEPRVRTAGNWQSWQSHTGATVACGGPGSVMYVPRGCPHAFANPGPGPARMIFLVSPPGTSTIRRNSLRWSPTRQARWMQRSPSCAPAMTLSSSPRR